MNGAEWLIFIVYDLVVARASLLALCVRGGGGGGMSPELFINCLELFIKFLTY